MCCWHSPPGKANDLDAFPHLQVSRHYHAPSSQPWYARLTPLKTVGHGERVKPLQSASSCSLGYSYSDGSAAAACTVKTALVAWFVKVTVPSGNCFFDARRARSARATQAIDYDTTKRPAHTKGVHGETGAQDWFFQAANSFGLNERIRFPFFVSLVAFCWVSRRTDAQLDLTEASLRWLLRTFSLGSCLVAESCGAPESAPRINFLHVND